MLRLPRFDYLAPRSLEEAITLLAKEQGGAKVIAGGTDLLVKMKKRETKHQKLIGLKHISDLDSIQEEGELIKLGPMVTHNQAGHSDLLNKHTGILSKACQDLGPYQVRCMGTIGGNICNASPSADSIPSLLVLEAQLRILNCGGEKTLPLDQFFLGPFKTILRNDEIITSIEIPKPLPASRGVYLKIPKVTEKDETLVGIAVLLMRDASKGIIEHIRIGLGSVAPTPIRAKKTEQCLVGKDLEDQTCLREAEEVLANEIFPRSRSDYRKRMTGYLFHQALGIVQSEILQGAT
jgi:CO/xanthine dehydrogenase FAD-binding subunit